MTLRTFLKLWAPQVPETWGAAGAPNFSFLLFYRRRRRRKMGTAGALNGGRRCPKRGARGATPPEGEGNPAEGGYFASILYENMYEGFIFYIFHIHEGFGEARLSH